MKALTQGELELASRLLDCEVPPGWPDGHDQTFLTMRREQLRKHPELEPWLVRAMILRTTGRPMVGHAGFHGAPEGGRVEFGYTVFPERRGNGYALEASRALMRWATNEHGVRLFRLSAQPDNLPSLAIIRSLGFEQTGTQIDEVDGLELVFELDP